MSELTLAPFRENPGRRLVSNLHAVLILGPDAVAAASPATAVQLVHACHQWGFSTVIPASWGDELVAGEVIRLCASRDSRPAIQCSCPRVAERLGPNVARLDDAIFWLTTPPVAAAKYIRAHSPGNDVHITYAGSCPGAIDSSIDRRMNPTELLTAIGARGIDIRAQPTVFENIIPPDRRRHFSTAAGMPDTQRLWEAAAFRVAQPSDVDLSIGISQLLLSGERVLIDMTAQAGCVCRADPLNADATAILRAPSPVVRQGLIEISRPAPVAPEPVAISRIPVEDAPPVELPEEKSPSADPAEEKQPLVMGVRRNSPARPLIRRQTAWRRHTPRHGVDVTRTTGSSVTIPESPGFFRRTEVRVAILTAVAVGTLMLGVWIGRRQTPSPLSRGISTQSFRARSP